MLNDDELMQMAFELGEPCEDATGYWFSMEDWEKFTIELRKRLNAATTVKVAKMNSQVNKEKLTQIADHLQLLIEDLGDEGRDVDSEICIKAHDALRNIIATPAPIPNADHSEDVRAMVVPDGYKLVPIEPTAAQCFTAAFNLCNEFGDEFVRDNKQFALAAYRSLVAASQSAKGGE